MEISSLHCSCGMFSFECSTYVALSFAYANPLSHLAIMDSILYLIFFGRQLLTVFLNYVIPFIPTYGFYADRIILEDYSGFLKLFIFLSGAAFLLWLLI